jgi:RNA polymerase sigma-54 factor
VRRLGKGFDLERELLEEHFQELLERKVDRLSKALDIDEERLKDVLDFLKTLSFRPAAIFERKESGTLTPDATIKYDQPDALHPDGRFRILLSKRGTPELEVIPGTEYRSDSMTKEEKQYLSTQSSSAKALIEAIRRRNDTLQLTIAAICQRQVAFFEEGKSGLVPLQMQEIAQDLGMSAATVTRTVKDKVVQTDHGTFELRYFFSLKKVIMGNGMVADRDDLLNALKVVIEKEDKKKPLSDSAISKALKEKGHKVAIRTVSKYRDILDIPSSTKRKII